MGQGAAASGSQGLHAPKGAPLARAARGWGEQHFGGRGRDRGMEERWEIGRAHV